MSEGFNLPKNVAAEMVTKTQQGDLSNLKTVYNFNFNGGKSLRDKANEAMLEFTNDMSPALKNMHTAYLNEVRENCYQDKWISDDFTNEEQIKLCKQEAHDSVFKAWNQAYNNHRQSDKVRLNQCLSDAGTDLVRNVNCFEQAVKDIHTTNRSLKALFVQMNKNYL